MLSNSAISDGKVEQEFILFILKVTHKDFSNIIYRTNKGFPYAADSLECYKFMGCIFLIQMKLSFISPFDCLTHSRCSINVERMDFIS